MIEQTDGYIVAAVLFTGRSNTCCNLLQINTAILAQIQEAQISEVQISGATGRNLLVLIQCWYSSVLTFYVVSI